MLTICHQTSYLLGRMIARQEEEFTQHGGVRERMHAARTAYRAEEFSRGLYSYLAAARTAEELEGKVEGLRREIERIARGIARGRGWGE